jgi:hypothetical protein
MTEFQKRCKQNPTLIGTKECWELFKKLNPNIEPGKQKKKYEKQLDELFFNKVR